MDDKKLRASKLLEAEKEIWCQINGCKSRLSKLLVPGQIYENQSDRKAIRDITSRLTRYEDAADVLREIRESLEKQG